MWNYKTNYGFTKSDTSEKTHVTPTAMLNTQVQVKTTVKNVREKEQHT